MATCLIPTTTMHISTLKVDQLQNEAVDINSNDTIDSINWKNTRNNHTTQASLQADNNDEQSNGQAPFSTTYSEINNIHDVPGNQDEWSSSPIAGIIVESEDEEVVENNLHSQMGTSCNKINSNSNKGKENMHFVLDDNGDSKGNASNQQVERDDKLDMETTRWNGKEFEEPLSTNKKLIIQSNNTSSQHSTPPLSISDTSTHTGSSTDNVEANPNTGFSSARKRSLRSSNLKKKFVPLSSPEESNESEFIDDDESDEVASIIDIKEDETFDSKVEIPEAAPSSSTESDEESIPLSYQSKRRRVSARASSSASSSSRTQAKSIPSHERTHYRLIRQHPELEHVWEKLEEEAPREVKQIEQPKELVLNLLPFQREGVYWLKRQEDSSFGGGILADEMGMGKTIQTIALLLSEPRGKPTLVVAPVVAIMQWKEEIDTHTNKALSTYLYYGQARDISGEELSSYDVVLTSYNVIESVYRKERSGFRRKNGVVKEKSLLHQMEFYRIILDEAHGIKSRTCNTARAVCGLRTTRKICLSGTPLQNRIGELFSLLRFLRADPFAYYYCLQCECKSLHWRFSDRSNCDECGHKPMSHTCYFNAEMLKPIQKFGYEGPGKLAFKKVHSLLKHIMLRRTKLERADDLGLPPRVVEVRKDLFNEEEEDVYQSLYMDSKRKFNTYLAEGVVLNNYANIFQLITRMRQMADHPDLVLASKRKTVDIENQENIVCKICDEVAQDAIESRCHHTFCRLCVTEYINAAGDGENVNCPSCFIPLSIDLSAPALEDFSEEKFKNASILNRIDMNSWRSSTKIEALVEELYLLRKKDRTLKSIVFSQFTSMLDLIHWRLRKAGFNCVKLDGGMTPKARAATIEAFSNDINITIFLVSLKAGGVALNLTEASQVFMMDPWWNGAVQWQAMDRIHRIGQKRPIKVITLCIENSIESKIIELQEKKAQMIHATIDQDEKALNQLSVEDMQFLFSN